MNAANLPLPFAAAAISVLPPPMPSSAPPPPPPASPLNMGTRSESGTTSSTSRSGSAERITTSYCRPCCSGRPPKPSISSSHALLLLGPPLPSPMSVASGQRRSSTSSPQRISTQKPTRSLATPSSGAPPFSSPSAAAGACGPTASPNGRNSPSSPSSSLPSSPWPSPRLGTRCASRIVFAARRRAVSIASSSSGGGSQRSTMFCAVRRFTEPRTICSGRSTSTGAHSAAMWCASLSTPHAAPHGMQKW